MKRVLPITFFASLFLISGILLEQNTANSNASGPPGGFSGAPNLNNCTQCHMGVVNSGIGVPSISSNIPPSGYVAGETYTITTSITQSGINKFGFQLSTQNDNGNFIGDLLVTNSTETQIVSSNFIEHKFAGTAGVGMRTWSFDWKAPCAGEDSAIFYAAFNATNSNSSTSGDQVYTTSLTILEDVINTSDSVSNITMADVSDFLTGDDLEVTFTIPDCETRTLTYWLMVVKASQAATFDTTQALMLGASSRKSYSTGLGISSPSLQMGGFLDSDGDPIRNNEAYKVFILSVPDNSLVNKAALVESVNAITLKSPMAVVDSIIGKDIDNQGNGSDLQVNFISPADEKRVSEYRTIVVKASAASSFDLASANTLASSRYKVSNTGMPGAKIVVNYAAPDLDSDGSLITIGVPYTIFILSKADGINSINDTLQASLTDITLGLPAKAVNNVIGSDIDNNGDGRDLEVSFLSASDESTISEYRIIAVKSSAAPTFDVDDANNLTSSSFVVSAIGNAGMTSTIVFTSTSEDSDGDLIQEGQNYKIFVQSVSDGVNAQIDVLTKSQDDVILRNTTGISNIENSEFTGFLYENILSISIHAEIGNNSNYALYDVNGKILKSGSIRSQNVRIDVPDKSSIVILKLLIEGELFSEKYLNQ